MKIKDLQQLTLECQGLDKITPFGEGKAAVLSAIEHLGYIQIDTLSVVERAHHHTLWTRLPDYKSEYLEDLVKERKVFEYWFHAASYLPMKDFRFALPRMSYLKNREPAYYSKVTPEVVNYVYDKIRLDGPLKARDFKSSSTKSGSWWNWKPSKMALEKLFMQGDIMVSGRDGMEKIYDLTERVLPSNVDTTMPSPLEFAEYLVETYLRAYGFTTIKQITHLKTGGEIKINVKQVLQKKIEENLVKQIDIAGFPTMYCLCSSIERMDEIKSPVLKLLSPFDNAIIHRERIDQLFDFHFRLECYIPKEKREFGYFCLPILFNNEFIGRVDCKAHRKEEELELIHLHLQNTKIEMTLWIEMFVESIWNFAYFNGCKSVKITKVSPSSEEEFLRKAFERKLKDLNN